MISLTKIFKALADDIRLRIMRILINGPFHVNEILAITGLKQSNISHHLKILQESEMVNKKREGTLIYYTINETFFNKELKALFHILKERNESIPYQAEDKKRQVLVSEKRKLQAEKFFNSVGENFNNIQDNLFERIYSVKEALAFIKQKAAIAVDIGCGTGRNLVHLAKKAEKIIGIDSSHKMLQLSDHICQKHNLNYELKQGDIHKIPQADKSIQIALLNMVLHHSMTPVLLLKDVNRILNIGNHLILIDLLEHKDENMREKYADFWLGFSDTEIIDWLKQTGFRIEHFEKKGINNKLPVFILVARKIKQLSEN